MAAEEGPPTLDRLTLDARTLAQLPALMRMYSDLLAQSVAVQQSIASILERQIGPAAEVATRAYVTELERLPSATGAQAPIAVSSIAGPIKQLKPTIIYHYNLTTSATISTAIQQTFQKTPLWVIVDNIDQTNSIALSFDGQKTFKKILKNTALNLPPWTVPEDPNVYNFYFKSDDAASVAFQILSGEV